MKMKLEVYWLLACAATAFFILPSLEAADKVVVFPLKQHPVDRDGDGYHPPDDCDDSNPDVHPNAEWHGTSARGEVGWDWDCSGKISKRYPTLQSIAARDCNGFQLTWSNDFFCGTHVSGIGSNQMFSCYLTWNPLILPLGTCEASICTNNPFGNLTQECR